jgi:hypothetical protein
MKHPGRRQEDDGKRDQGKRIGRWRPVAGFAEPDPNEVGGIGQRRERSKPLTPRRHRQQRHVQSLSASALVQFLERTFEDLPIEPVLVARALLGLEQALQTQGVDCNALEINRYRER